MNVRFRSSRVVRTPLAAALLAGSIVAVSQEAASAAPAAAAACVSRAGPQPPAPPGNDSLHGVVVLAPCNAWAVGGQNGGSGFDTLIEHWNGSRWHVVAGPNPSPAGSFL